MTIEQKALELVNAVRRERGDVPLARYDGWGDGTDTVVALCRALGAHELDKSRHAAEMREQAERFSEAAREAVRLFVIGRGVQATEVLSPFILAPVDPLVEAIADTLDALGLGFASEKDGLRGEAEALRAALDARGLAIVKKEAVNG